MRRLSALLGMALLCTAAQAAAFLDAPADLLAPDDPAIARGHNLLLVAVAALKAPQKTDFESQASYVERVAGLSGARIDGSVALGSQISVPMNKATDRDAGYPVEVKYDAERGVLRLCLNFLSRDYAQINGKLTKMTKYRVDEEVVQKGRFVGRNAFGVTVRARRQTLHAVEVQMPSGPYMGNCAAEMAMSNADAQAMLPSAVVVVTARLVPPFATIDRSIEQATIDDPIEEHRVITKVYMVAEELLLVIPGKTVVYRAKSPAPG